MCAPCCWDESRVFILSMHEVFPKGNAAGVGEQTGFAIVCWGLKENVSCFRLYCLRQDLSGRVEEFVRIVLCCFFFKFPLKANIYMTVFQSLSGRGQ